MSVMLPTLPFRKAAYLKRTYLMSDRLKGILFVVGMLLLFFTVVPWVGLVEQEILC